MYVYIQIWNTYIKIEHFQYFEITFSTFANYRKKQLQSIKNDLFPNICDKYDSPGSIKYPARWREISTPKMLKLVLAIILFLKSKIDSAKIPENIISPLFPQIQAPRLNPSSAAESPLLSPLFLSPFPRESQRSPPNSVALLIPLTQPPTCNPARNPWEHTR